MCPRPSWAEVDPERWQAYQINRRLAFLKLILIESRREAYYEAALKTGCDLSEAGYSPWPTLP
jgi:hypothetical protein